MEVYEKLEEHAKVGGKSPDEKASEIVVKKATEKPVKKKGAEKAAVQKEITADKPVFPVQAEINTYGFIHLNQKVAESFDVPKGKKTPITIGFKDGSLIISKA